MNTPERDNSPIGRDMIAWAVCTEVIDGEVTEVISELD